MIALAQGGAGLALVMCFALLRSRQIAAAAVFLTVQSAATALAAVVLHHPLMAAPPVSVATGIWLLRQRTPMLEPGTAPTGGAKLGIAVGIVMAALCQSQGVLALPTAIVLLSVLLAATRSHPLMHIIALGGLQNGLGLAANIVAQPIPEPLAVVVPIACLALPLPLAAGLLIPALLTSQDGIATQRLSPFADMPSMTKAWAGTVHRLMIWSGWIDLTLAVASFAMTLIVPLDGLASVFAPLLGLDGVLRSYARRNRAALGPVRRGAALAQSAFIILAVCAPHPVIAWLSVLAAAAAGLSPLLARRWNSAVLVFFAAGIALFGIVLLPAVSSVLNYLSVFAGFVMITSVIPDLVPAIVILILRLGCQMQWPFAVQALGSSLSILALLTCASLLLIRAGANRTSLIQLAQASLAILAICLGQPDSRFAAFTLVMLMILTRAATRCVGEPASVLALAGLGGIPPLGVFPGLVLVVLTLSAHCPWLLLPIGIGLIPVMTASLPLRFPTFAPRASVPSVAWLPLLLSLLAGYCAPEQLVHWWRILTAGRT
jgi:hypothetical protein